MKSAILEFNSFGSGFPKSGLTLDVGCGNNPRGSVNVDLGVKGDLGLDRCKPPSRFPNFVKATAEYLPFKDKSFEKVVCCQVIEHLKSPGLALKEMVRVAVAEICLETYHVQGEWLIVGRKKRAWFKKQHTSKMSFSTLAQMAQKVGVVTVKQYVISWNYFPSRWISLVKAPAEIGVLLRL